MSLIFWSENASADDIRKSSSVMLRQELGRLYSSVSQIDAHLSDPTRPERFPSRREYDDWATKAAQARTFKACAISRVEAVLDERGEPSFAADEVTAVAELVAILHKVKWHPEEDADILSAIRHVAGLLLKRGVKL